MKNTTSEFNFAIDMQDSSHDEKDGFVTLTSLKTIDPQTSRLVTRRQDFLELTSDLQKVYNIFIKKESLDDNCFADSDMAKLIEL